MANESAKFVKNCFVGWTMTHGLHYPHDYDPKKVQQLSRAKTRKQKREGTHTKEQMVMTMIIPFTFQCDVCSEFQYLGKKQNFKVEPVPCEDGRGAQSYLGVRIMRFRGKCTECSSEFVMRSDPKSGGYLLEKGGRRMHEDGRDRANVDEMLDKEDKARIHRDKVSELDQKRKEAQENMKSAEAVEDIMTINARGRDRHGIIDNAMADLDKLYRDFEEGRLKNYGAAGTTVASSGGKKNPKPPINFR
jgi:hypothetical protein